MSDLGIDSRQVTTALPDPETADTVMYDPSMEELRAFSEHMETTTEYGSPAYVSEYRSRSADRTKNAIDDTFTAEDYRVIDAAVEGLGSREMVCVDRLVGRHPETTYCCRLYVPREYGRIALSWATLFEPSDGREPDFTTVQLPEVEDTRIRILPEEGFTAVLGSDYTGEAKKSFLRLFMFEAKRQGGLGLHAGSKRVRVERDDDLETVGQLFLGLSATGKSTLTGHGFWLDDPEEAVMLQDDVCALLDDGTVAGSEGNGLYIKTIGLDREEQPALYDAATDETAVLENVAVDEDGTVDFEDDEHTSNSRAAIRRDRLASADDTIDLPEVDQVFFITRNPLMPPIAKLDPAEGAAAFMLGESVETSAGDPERAGESIRVVGTNPFIIGPEGEEGNRFYDLLEAADIDPYVINTGTVGESVDVAVEDSVRILTAVARDSIEWHDDERLGLTVPASVPGMDVDRFSVPEVVADYERELERLRADRREYLEGFPKLREEIVEAVY